MTEFPFTWFIGLSYLQCDTHGPSYAMALDSTSSAVVLIINNHTNIPPPTAIHVALTRAQTTKTKKVIDE